MKIQYLKLLSSLILLTFIIGSCSSEESDTGETNNENTVQDEYIEEVLTVEDVFQKLNEVKFPQDFDYESLGSSSFTKSSFKIPAKNFDKMNLLKDAYYEDFVTFEWIYYEKEISLLCVSTDGFFAKGPSYEYHLVSFDNNFNKLDELKFAGLWTVSVENPYGGTSAGEEYQTAVLKLSDNKLNIITDEATYTINEKGSFIKEIKAIEAIALNEFIQFFKPYGNLPLYLDDEFLENNSSIKYEALNAGQVLTLFKKGQNIANIYGGDYTVEAFIMIDSIKQAGTYDEFVQSDNPGETEESDAFALYKLKLDNNISAYIWKIYDATQEMGGPHSSGTIYYISFSENNKILSSYPIAEFSSGGDAPMWGERIISAKIQKNGELNINNIYIEGDDDAGTTDTIKQVFQFKFFKTELEVINNPE